MAKKDIREILEKIESGSFTPQEEEAAKLWLFQLHNKNRAEVGDSELFEARDEIRTFLAAQVAPVKTTRLWPRITIAAAIFCVVFGSILIYITRSDKPAQDLAGVKQDVAPGKVGATLTLASGKKIRLSDAANGELAREAGVVVSKSADGQLTYEIKDSGSEENKINTLSTANGETYRLRLPDGSLVWLNAASSITYNAHLIENGKRSVQLTGEGYFEIAKDKDHPFVVESGGQQVEVLGTHFNINAYKDEPAIATTLLEGLVKVSSGKNFQLIVPGQQALNTGTGFTVSKVNTDNIIDWKDGEFNLDEVDFRVAMRKISRWYDVKLVYDQSVPEGIKLGGWISRNQKLSAVLKMLEDAGFVHSRIQGRKLYLSRSK